MVYKLIQRYSSAKFNKPTSIWQEEKLVMVFASLGLVHMHGEKLWCYEVKLKIFSVIFKSCGIPVYNWGFWCMVACTFILASTNLLLTEREGCTGEYWRNIGQYSPVRLELARLVSSLSYGTRAILVLNLRASFQKQKIHGSWLFPWKRFVWRNPDQERTNQNARICRAI